jgi:PTH1 family peptidyl-tRNA hydrolase
MKNKTLVVGLGNPEGKYFNTYHNVGFVCAEKLAQEVGAEFKKKGNQSVAVADKLYILKPLTYMNLSGQAVQAVLRKHRIAVENLMIFADDIYIDKGNIRVSFGGSSGGHNGLNNINEIIGTKQYTKIRVGVKPEKSPHSITNYVLSKVDKDDNLAIEKAVKAALMLITGESLEKVQNVFNTTNVCDRSLKESRGKMQTLKNKPN